jgi:hypothetical protein
MAKPTLSYSEITDATEVRIRHFMALAAVRRAENQTAAQSIEDYAYGAFALWNELTFSAQEPGEADRMIALTVRQAVDHG